LNRFRLGAVVALAVSAALAGVAPRAQGSAEVHKFSLIISAIPTSIDGGSLNTTIKYFNDTQLTPKGLEGLSEIQFGWMFDAELHYFVRPNVAVGVGVGQIRGETQREFLPALSQDIQIRAELLSVPIHAGLDYYFTPYNQGDFQARAYVGAGALGTVGNKALLQQQETGTDSTTTLGGSYVRAVTRDSPGYYLETGVHMFFASKFSVMLGGVYRSIVVRDMVDRDTGQPVLDPTGKPFTLNVSGIGAKMAIGIGF